MIRRREFITLIGGAVTSPLAARAQQQSVPVIGFISSRSPDESLIDLAGSREAEILRSGPIRRSWPISDIERVTVAMHQRVRYRCKLSDGSGVIRDNFRG
jgi:hypothetical protein